MNQSRRDLLFIICLSALFFLTGLGGVHLFDWDEINFAEAAREMLTTGDYLRIQIDYRPFWEKPPLFMWMQAAAMHIFGVTEYAARFPNAVCGVLTLICIYVIGKRHFSRDFALLWTLAFGGSILPHLYFKSGIIDPWFNLFIFLGIYHFINFIFKRKKAKATEEKYSLAPLLLAGAFIGTAVLTKGPVAYLIVCLVLGVNWLSERFKFFVSVSQFLLFTLAVIAVTGVWFGADIWRNGMWFTETFIDYQIRLFSTEDAGHGGFFGYHFVVLLVGCFPASVPAVFGFKKSQLTDYQRFFKKFMLILFWVVLILFSIVESKIVHYSSLCYFPLSFLAATCLYELHKAKKRPSPYLQNALLGLGILLSVIVIIVPFFGQNIDLLRPLFAQDKFALANLNAEVTWTGFESVAGVILLLTVLLAHRFFRQKRIPAGSKILFLGTALFVQTTLFLYINNIEEYSQRAAIEFYENFSEKEVYIATVGFKSYAHLFYAKKQSGGDERQQDLDWLLHGSDLDRDTYFVTKIHKKERLETEKNLRKIGEKNGFVFFVRERVRQD